MPDAHRPFDPHHEHDDEPRRNRSAMPAAAAFLAALALSKSSPEAPHQVDPSPVVSAHIPHATMGDASQAEWLRHAIQNNSVHVQLVIDGHRHGLTFGGDLDAIQRHVAANPKGTVQVLLSDREEGGRLCDFTLRKSDLSTVLTAGAHYPYNEELSRIDIRAVCPTIDPANLHMRVHNVLPQPSAHLNSETRVRFDTLNPPGNTQERDI